MSDKRNIELAFDSILKNTTSRNRNAFLAQKLDDDEWLVLRELFKKNGLLPLFCNRLLSLPTSDLPEGFSEQSKLTYLNNLTKNLVLEKEILRILDHLRHNGIPAIPLKGPILARYIYRDAALRQTSSDIDILIKPDKLSDAVEKISELGYQTNALESASIKNIIRFRRQLLFYKRSGTTKQNFLELHWDFRDKFVKTHIARFWQSSREIELEGHKILMPSPEDLVIYLAIVSIYDFGFVQLRYLSDLDAFVRNHSADIDWKRIAEEIRNRHLHVPFYFAVKLAVTFFDTPIPGDFMAGLNPPVIKTALLRRIIHKHNILWKRESFASTYKWCHIITSYIFARDMFDFVLTVYRKIFLPIEEVASLGRDTGLNRPSTAYLKRLRKPVTRFLAKHGYRKI